MQQYFITGTRQVGDALWMTEEQAHHIMHVMRMKEGESIRLADEAAQVFLARVHFAEKRVQAILYEQLAQPEPKAEITLLMGLIKGEKWEWVLQKACELGVDHIVPVALRYSVVKLDMPRFEKKRVRWQTIMQEACEQCHRPTLARLHEPIGLARLHRYQSDLNLIAYERADRLSAPLAGALRGSSFHSVSVLIGCEGGFAPEEAALAKQQGFRFVSLGERILRAETAALAVLADLDYEWEARRRA